MTGSLPTTVIVGATGYIGRHVSRELAEQGAMVHAFGRGEWKVENPTLSNQVYHTGDICDQQTIEEIVSLNPDAIIYCVSLDQYESGVDVKRAVAVNLSPLWTLAENLNKKSKKSVRFVYLSTTHVYGVLHGAITEQVSPQPRTVYGLTHLMCEQVLRRYSRCGVLEPVSIRLSNSYGPPVSENAGCWKLVLNDFCRSAIEAEQIQLSSDGTPQRDFVYVEDVAISIAKLLQMPYQALMQVYNIGSGNTKTMLELANKVQQVYFDRSGRRCPIVLGDGRIVVEASDVVRHKAPRQFVLDVSASHAREMSASTSLADGVNKLFDFLESRSR